MRFFVLMMTLLIFAACSESQQGVGAPGEPVRPQADEGLPVMMYNLDKDILDTLGINFRVTNEQARLVRQWAISCRPDLAMETLLSDHAVETLTDGSRNHYRFYPIFAHVEVAPETQQIVKSNPQNYHINLEAIVQDYQAAPCDIPPGYEIIGYVTAMTPMEPEELTDLGQDGSPDTHEGEDVVVDSDESEQACEEDSFEVVRPDDGSSYEYRSACVDGVLERELVVAPATTMPLVSYQASVAGLLVSHCNAINNVVDTLSRLEETIANSEGSLAQYWQEHLSRTKEMLDYYEGIEGLSLQFIFNERELMDNLIEDYRRLNPTPGLVIRTGGYAVHDLSVTISGRQAPAAIEEHLSPIFAIVPGGVSSHGPVTAMVRMNSIQACLATDFTGEVSALNGVLQLNLQ